MNSHRAVDITNLVSAHQDKTIEEFRTVVRSFFQRDDLELRIRVLFSSGAPTIEQYITHLETNLDQAQRVNKDHQNKFLYLHKQLRESPGSNAHHHLVTILLHSLLM